MKDRVSLVKAPTQLLHPLIRMNQILYLVAADAQNSFLRSMTSSNRKQQMDQQQCLIHVIQQCRSQELILTDMFTVVHHLIGNISLIVQECQLSMATMPALHK